MVDFLYGFILLNKLKRLETVFVFAHIIMTALITNKIAESFGYFYDPAFQLTIDYLVTYVFSGHFVALLFFIGVGYVFVNHATAFIPYLISTIWNDRIYDFQKHIAELEEFDVIRRVKEGVVVDKNYDGIYMTIINDSRGERQIMRVVRNLFSVIIAFSFILIAYDVVGLVTDIVIVGLMLYFFVNVTFFMVKYRSLNFHKDHLEHALQETQTRLDATKVEE